MTSSCWRKDFLKRFGAQNGRDGLAFNPEAIQAIVQHPWSGNVRELQNRIQRAVIMADGRWITEADLEIGSPRFPRNPGDSPRAGLSNEAPTSCGLKEARENLEREMVLQALERNDYKISAAAQELGISRPTFYELMNKLGISKDA